MDLFMGSLFCYFFFLLDFFFFFFFFLRFLVDVAVLVSTTPKGQSPKRWVSMWWWRRCMSRATGLAASGEGLVHPISSLELHNHPLNVVCLDLPPMVLRTPIVKSSSSKSLSRIHSTSSDGL